MGSVTCNGNKGFRLFRFLLRFSRAYSLRGNGLTHNNIGCCRLATGCGILPTAIFGRGLLLFFNLSLYTIGLFVGWAVIGLIVYAVYGYRHGDEAADLSLVTSVDGEVKQDANTNQMVYSIAELIAYVSAFATLLPGDVLLTGTPAGVGPLLAGQRVSVEIDGIGHIENIVVPEPL